MPRSRMIRPEFWDDEKLSKISRAARLIFIALWNFSDDYGVVKAHPRWLINHIFPYEDSLSIQKFKGWLKELEKMGCILPFSENGEGFYLIKNFLKHQVINRPSKQRLANPPDSINEHSLSSHGTLILETETETETEDKSHTKKKKFIPPQEKDVISYFKEKGYSEQSAKKAFEYYDTGKWKDSKGNQVLNWKQKMIAVWFKEENRDQSLSAYDDFPDQPPIEDLIS